MCGQGLLKSRVAIATACPWMWNVSLRRVVSPAPLLPLRHPWGIVCITGDNTLNHQSLSSFTWSVADLLHGDYKQSEFKRVRQYTTLTWISPETLVDPLKNHIIALLALGASL